MPRNLAEMARQSCDEFADRKALGTRSGDRWIWTTYRELGALTERFRGGLASLGVGPGDRVGIVSRNRVEWAAACFASYGLGAVFVPMYEHQRPDEWAFILADAGARVAIAGNARIAGELELSRAGMPALRHVISLEPSADPLSFASLVEVGAAHPAPAHDVGRDEIATFIYTSGTTGRPKGVILTHGNILANMEAMEQVFPLEEGDLAVSFLPWAHSYGQTVELYMGTRLGVASALNQDVTRLLDDLADVRPTILIAVPRIFNLLYDRVQHEIAGKPRLIQRLFHDGIDGAMRRSRGERVGARRRIALAIAERLIFSRVRERFGGRLRLVGCGAAALSRDVGEFIDALGLAVYVGYGLTETSPVVTMNTPNARRLGSSGKPLPGVRVEFDRSVSGDGEDGEIIVYGANVMRGYHERPAENAAAFTADGGLRTGDLGHVDQDGFLYITGRLKEQYKLDNAKFVMPAPLEEQLQMSHYIASVMLYGLDRPFNVALVVPRADAIQEWLQQEGVGPEDRDRRVRELIRDELAAHSAGFKSYEVPKRFALLPRDFSVDDDTLTPTLKLKRRNVVARYQELIDELYAEPLAGPPPAPEPLYPVTAGAS